MSIDFSLERWNHVKAAANAWWAGELDRPLFCIAVGNREPDRPEPQLPGKHFHSFYDLSISADAIIDRLDYNLSTQRFYGDAFPSVWMNFGPGVAAAFLGAELRNGENTVWFHTDGDREVGEIELTFDENNVWVRRICDLYEAGLQRWQGLVQMGMTDLGGSLDILASFRPGEKLLFDLYDSPEDVKAKTWEIHEYWWKYYSFFNATLQPVNPGYTAWANIFSDEPYYMLQCDFAYMIGPEMFDEFVKPELAASCKKLQHAFYHLDGPGQLPHLDSLLSIPELRGIQWIPGDGQPDVTHWPEVYRKIRDAGKLIQVFVGPGNFHFIDILAEQLGSADGIVFLGNAGQEDFPEVESILQRYNAL
ncbi:MAG TPA: hypothetical protein VHV83_16285 [Armatimonadota bacterium]|nr:hypothetical protein [Armatimonadota bacterium]